MGIQYLNKLIRTKCSGALKQIPLSNLRKKVIVIDTSIYLYRFAGEGGIVDGMYQMISIFLMNHIIPVFVFDGRPPPEKYDILTKRKSEKKTAEEKTIEIQNKIDDLLSKDIYADTSQLDFELGEMKKKCLKISYRDTENVKELMKLMGVTYFIADGEADELCAKLVIKKYAWAVLSEDMDMFVYGCNRVLRYLSLINNTVMLYNTRDILKTLKLTQKQFREICVLSGTDYNAAFESRITLDNTLKYFDKYRKRGKGKEFYIWMTENSDYIEDYYHLCSTYIMFEVQNLNIAKFEKQKIMNGPVNISLLHTFLEKFGFIFI